MKSKTYRQPLVAVAGSDTPASKSLHPSSAIDTSDRLANFVERFKAGGKPITVNFRRALPQLKATDRFTHLIHPYPAKLLHHIPFFFLANPTLSKPGDLILDPFCGSGTVLLEAQLAGRNAVGADANPLARLVATSKTQRLLACDLRRCLQRILRRVGSGSDRSPPDVVNLSHWFYPSAVRQLSGLRDAINGTRNLALRDFFLVCFSVCVRKVSLADPRLSVPVRLRRDQYPADHPFREKYDRHLRRLKRVNVVKVFHRITIANIARMERLSTINALGRSEVICSDARNLHHEYSLSGTRKQSLARDSVQLIITSPPYPGAQKYIRASSLSLGWLGLCRASDLRHFKARAIGREEFRKADCAFPVSTGLPHADAVLRRLRKTSAVRGAIAATYLAEMREAIVEMHRVLKPGGHLILVAANSKIGGSTFRTVNYLRRIAQDAGFYVKASLIDAIRSRGLMTKRNSTASVITREYVLVLQKGGC